MPHRTVALLLLATAAALETLHLSNKRSCLFHAPEETTTPVPLVVVLHGYNVEPLNTLDFYFSDLKRLAEERGLAIAAPRGRRLGARGNDGSLCWAAGACCCRTKTKDDADVSFIDEVVEAAAHAGRLAPRALVRRSEHRNCAAPVVFDVVDELGHWPSFGLLQTDLRAPLLFAIYGEPITAASAKNNVRLGRPTRIKHYCFAGGGARP
ncbi:hypothetical protein JL722_5507 [Aureococcus anophagefferens]|nr:hypothetical protein JL722_5507 [Aureococcus anophagefferens]